MKRQRVILTGGSGLLSLNWACAMRDKWDVILGTHLHRVSLAGTTSCKLELDDPSLLEQQLDELAPDLIVHTAGLTNVDRCEQDTTLARQANAGIARNVAFAAAIGKRRLIHISTDHLFAGNSSFYQEDARPEPLNEYARSKLLAEELVQEVCPQAVIVRTNFFGWGSEQRQSFSDWIIYNLRAGKSLSLFDDVYFTPILADTLALTAHELVDSNASGVFNLVGDQRMSKYEFALQLAEHFGLPVQLIRRDQVAHASLQAKRPRDMSLDNAKAIKVLGRNLGILDEYLAGLRGQEKQGRPVELFHCISK
jgi:dTDP-4-dehydrorhamnose reductase